MFVRGGDLISRHLAGDSVSYVSFSAARFESFNGSWQEDSGEVILKK